MIYSKSFSFSSSSSSLALSEYSSSSLETLLQSLHYAWHILLELSENVSITCNWIKLISTNAFLAAFLYLWKARFLCKTDFNRTHCQTLRASKINHYSPCIFLRGDLFKFESLWCRLYTDFTFKTWHNFRQRRIDKIALWRRRTCVGIGSNAIVRTKFTLTKNPCESVSKTDRDKKMILSNSSLSPKLKLGVDFVQLKVHVIFSVSLLSLVTKYFPKSSAFFSSL